MLRLCFFFFVAYQSLWLAVEALSSLTIDGNVFVFPMIRHDKIGLSLKIYQDQLEKGVL